MLQKNQLIPLEIQSVTSEGSGVGRYEGMAVFVPGTAPGDRLTARVVKVLSSYCYGIVEELLEPGPGRVEPACPVCRRCGGRERFTRAVGVGEHGDGRGARASGRLRRSGGRA